MNKNLITLFITLLSINNVFSQTDKITITSTSSVGTEVGFVISQQVKNTYFRVDFGDGNLVNRDVDTIPAPITGTLGSSKIITIYGTNITYFSWNLGDITSLDVTDVDSLKQLDCTGNNLSSLDLSNNTALKALFGNNNNFTSLNLKQNRLLEQLQISKNELTNIDLSNNTNLIDLKCNYNQLTTIDISWNKKLLSVQCNNNKLTSLDVSRNILLQAIDCSNNLLESLDITSNTKLGRLSCSYNSIQGLNLSLNPTLYYLDCSHNKLSALDMSNNDQLFEIYCNFNQITSLNTSYNTYLYSLSCTDNQLISLNVGNNKALIYLYCYYNQLQNLDVTQNTALEDFLCNNNKLTNLNITNNIALKRLWCYNNQLTNLDVSKNTVLDKLICYNNRLTYATLPDKSVNIKTYEYAPQAPITISKKWNTGTALDLSSQLMAFGNTTVYNWKTITGTTLSEGTDYAISNGITTFLKNQNDSVYCEMTNGSFTQFIGLNVLKTTNMKVTLTTDKKDLNSVSTKIYSSNKMLFINLSYNAYLTIFDITGKFVTNKQINSGENILQMPRTGVYLVKISGNNKVVTQKICVE